MNIEVDKHRKQLEKKIGRFSGEFMSDTKWTKVFKVLSSHSNVVNKCFIKDVFSDPLQEVRIPKNFDSAFNNKGIKDIMTGGSMAYMEIEWIELPSNWIINREMRYEKLEPRKYSQNIFKIKEYLGESGQLEIEISDGKLFVFGYK